MSGLFITLEGSDGAGKTLQSKLLAHYFEELGENFIVTREPGGSPIGEQIRNIVIDKNNIAMGAITEALLYAAARAQHVCEVILPALSQGKIVICDRFVDSSISYQGHARGLGMEEIKNLNFYATAGLQPDITFFLDLEPKLGIARKKKEAVLDRLELEVLEFHNKVYDGYKILANENPNRIITINALQTPEEIHLTIKNFVVKLLKNK